MHAELRKEALVIKFSYFLYYAAISGVQSFLSIILYKKGLNDAEIGMANAIWCLGALVSPFLFSYCADKNKSTKLLLITCVMISIFLHAIPMMSLAIMNKNVPVVDTKNSTNNKSFLSNHAKNLGSHSSDMRNKEHNLDFDNPVEEGTKEPIHPTGSSKLTKKLLYVLAFIFPCAMFDQATKALLDASTFKIINTLKKKNKTEKVEYGKQKVFGTIGYSMTTLLSGTLTNFIANENIKNIIQSIMCMILGIILVVLLVCMYPDVETEKKPQIKTHFRNLWLFPSLILMIFTHFVIHFLNSITRNLIPVYVYELKKSEFMVGMFITLDYLSEIAVMPFAETVLISAGGQNKIICWALINHALNKAILSFADSPAVPMFYSINNGLLFGIYSPTVYNAIAENCEESTIAVSLSLLSTSSKLGAVIANVIGGFLLSKIGFSKLFLLSSSGFLNWAIVFCFFHLIYSVYDRKREAEKTPSEENIQLISQEEMQELTFNENTM